MRSACDALTLFVRPDVAQVAPHRRIKLNGCCDNQIDPDQGSYDVRFLKTEPLGKYRRPESNHTDLAREDDLLSLAVLCKTGLHLR